MSSKLDLIKETYDSYFERLKALVKAVQNIEKAIVGIPETEKQAMLSITLSLKKDIVDFSRHLLETGVEIVRRV